MNHFLRECWVGDFEEHGKGTNIDEHKLIVHFAQVVKCNNFLEIGTLTGDLAKRMSKYSLVTTVDIKENAEFAKYTKESVDDDYTPKITYHTCGSDAFFKDNRMNFNVIFIDGDHSYRQSKKDLENSLEVLLPNGVILMHDVKKTKRGTKECLRTFEEFNRPGYVKFRIKTKNWLGVIWHHE